VAEAAGWSKKVHGMKKEILGRALRSWIALNDVLRGADEKLCRELLEKEIARRPRRKQFISRIHSRLNKARADRERKELNL